MGPRFLLVRAWTFEAEEPELKRLRLSLRAAEGHGRGPEPDRLHCAREAANDTKNLDNERYF